MEDCIADSAASGGDMEDSDTESFVDAMEELTTQTEKLVDFTDSHNSPKRDCENLSGSSSQSDCQTESATSGNVLTESPTSGINEQSDDDSSSESETGAEDNEKTMDDMIKTALDGESVLPPGECDSEVPSGECHGEDDEPCIDEDARKEEEALMSDEEKQMKKDEAQGKKTEGNERFKSENYQGAIECYTDALMICPLCYAKERSIMFSNRAASKYKLERHETAIEDCTKALELNPVYLKALLRRADIYEKADKLDDALADYTKALEMDPSLGQARYACQTLPGRIEERNEKLKEEMFGKLKDLGNMILKPFGLSTNNFQMQKDPNSGSYSMQFKQSEQEPPNGK